VTARLSTTILLEQAKGYVKDLGKSISPIFSLKEVLITVRRKAMPAEKGRISF
jgi:hypothetical protein